MKHLERFFSADVQTLNLDSQTGTWRKQKCVAAVGLVWLTPLNSTDWMPSLAFIRRLGVHGDLQETLAESHKNTAVLNYAFQTTRPQEVPKTLNTSYNLTLLVNPHIGSVFAAASLEYMNRVKTLYQAIQYISLWHDKKESAMVPWRRFDRPSHCPTITATSNLVSFKSVSWNSELVKGLQGDMWDKPILADQK